MALVSCVNIGGEGPACKKIYIYLSEIYMDCSYILLKKKLPLLLAARPKGSVRPR